MKRLLLVLMASLAMQLTFAQIRKIPSEVTNAFATKYPDAKDVQWKDNVTSFSAHFTSKNGTSCEANYNGKGEWQSTEEDMDPKNMPAEVKDGFSKSKYSDRELGECMKIEKKDAEVQYRLLAKKNGVEKKYLYFNKHGKLMKEAMTL